MLPSNVLPLKRPEHDVKLAEDLKLYLGMKGDTPFDMLSMEDKEEVGNRLERILLIVANGSLVSLMISIVHKMYNTHDAQHLTKLDYMAAKLLGEAVPNMNQLISDNVSTSKSQEKVPTTAEELEESAVLKGTPCPNCSKIFKNNHSLQGHLRDVHSTVTKVHSCPECGKTFVRKNNLKAHRETKHYGKKFPCQLCDQTFTKQNRLKEHIMRIHNTVLKRGNDKSRLPVKTVESERMSKETVEKQSFVELSKRSKISGGEFSFLAHPQQVKANQVRVENFEDVDIVENKMCLICNTDITHGSLEVHLEQVHKVGMEEYLTFFE